MSASKLKTIIQLNIEPGSTFKNPGKGQSVVAKINDNKISYKRGRSSFSLRFDDINKTYNYFIGQEVTTRDLKTFAPSVFDSNALPSGHNCNCTFLFLILNHIGFATAISGKGVVGDPFKCQFLKGAC